MAQIASVDWDLKRYYLHQDTVTAGFDAWLAVAEIKLLQQLNVNGEQNYELFMQRQGKFKKSEGVFTERFVTTSAGWRGVPYDSVAHSLRLLTELVSDDGVSNRDAFDRSSISVNVDIDNAFGQVEFREIAIGSGVVPQDLTDFVDTLMARVLENGLTFEQMQRIMLAEAAGKLLVSGNTVSIRDNADKKDRITATVDENGQRTSVTVDGS